MAWVFGVFWDCLGLSFFFNYKHFSCRLLSWFREVEAYSSSPAIQETQIPFKRGGKNCLFNEKSIHKHEKWIILNHGTSHCSEEMGNSERESVLVMGRSSAHSHQSVLRWKMSCPGPWWTGSQAWASGVLLGFQSRVRLSRKTDTVLGKLTLLWLTRKNRKKS